MSRNAASWGDERFFHVGQTPRHGLVVGQDFAQPDEGPDQGDADRDSPGTVQYIGGHEDTVLGEGERRNAAAAVGT